MPTDQPTDHFNLHRTTKVLPKKHLKSFFVNEVMDTGDEVTIMESGPISIKAACGNPGCSSNSEVCLVLKLEYDEDILVFGDLDDDSGLNDDPIDCDNVLTAGDVYEEEMWDVSSEGNGSDNRAVWTSTGHYVGWGGDWMVGIQRDDALEVVGGNCIVAGVINYYIPNQGVGAV